MTIKARMVVDDSHDKTIALSTQVELLVNTLLETTLALKQLVEEERLRDQGDTQDGNGE